MALTTLTLPALRRKVAAGLGGGFVKGDIDSGSATTVVDNTTHTIYGSQGRAALYGGWYLLRPDANDVPSRIRRVSRHEPSTGTLTTGGPNYADTTFTSEEYELHRYLDPDDADGGLLAAINNALKNRLRYLVTVPETLVVDGDMETSGITNWTATNLGTDVKVTAAATVFGGTQALHAVTNAANGYAASDAINVLGGQSYYIEAIVRSADATSTPKLVLVDQSGNEIDSWQASADMGMQADINMDWISLGCVAVQIPTGDTTVAIRLQGVENGADLYWDSVIFTPQRQREPVLPTWIEDENQLMAISWPLGALPRTWEWITEELYNQDVRIEAAAANHALLRKKHRTTRREYITAWRPYAAFSTGADIDETETRSVPEDWAVQACLVEAYDLLMKGQGVGEKPDNLEFEYLKAQRKARDLAWHYMRPKASGMGLGPWQEG